MLNKIARRFRWLRRRSRAWRFILEEQAKIVRIALSWIFAGMPNDRAAQRELQRRQRNTVRLRRYYEGKRPWYVPKWKSVVSRRPRRAIQKVVYGFE